MDQSSLHESLQSMIDVNRISLSSTNSISEGTGLRLGERAPLWVHDNHVTMCQLCVRHFTLLCRRHHCRACGRVVCSDCSNRMFFLKYLNNNARVCQACFDELSQNNTENFETVDKGVVKCESEPNVPSNEQQETIIECQTPNTTIMIHTPVSDTSTKSDLLHKNRSNSCTDIPIHYDLDSAYNSLSRNNNYRLSSRARKNLSAVLVEVCKVN